MSDSNDELTTMTEEPPPDSRLIERLLARATHSLGLIDVRRAEHHYARIMDWLAARTPLVEHLKSRYGLTEDEGVKGLGLAFADAGAHVGDEAVSLSAAPDSFTASASEQLFTAVAHVPDDSAVAETEARRIIRRGVPTFSPTSSETIKPASEQAGPHQEQTRATDAAQTSGPRAATTPAEESIPSPTRRTILSVEERGTVSTAEHDKTLARVEESLASAVESAPARPAGPNVARGSTDVSDTTDTDESSRAAKPGALRVAESSGANTLPPETAARGPFGVREGRSATGAFVVNEEEEMALMRRGAESPASKAAGVKTFVMSETQAASVSEETPRTLAHAREIPANDFGRESASLHAQSPLPLALSPVGVERDEATRRQNDSVPAVTHASSGGAETFTPGGARAVARDAEINVERLTEQVSRHLARRLLVERERRGLGRR